ncbi:LysR family transcriptional regulator [Rhodococcus sp. KBW08]|uniref:LysR family transcriptional regulator n=1 Tax=Rhodococcus sp. KBW08 TaxID=2144188 RepID=UPI000F591BC1|nr:LysR family transcriptional regulator [Rhodococcus sp. KBW08]RQO46100.1 LysR family transcriptional regulator [Rhodococcus sp. KBW08]
MLSADDLRVFAEVARRGRLTEAATHLQVNHTTVSRHITRLERAVESRLFDRTANGWILTDAGLRLLVHAEAIESTMRVVQDDCLSQDSSLSGHVRIITPDGFGAYLLLPRLEEFQRQHPDLTVEVVMANRHASLTPREFDLAVTIERPQARAVTVRKLAHYSLGFYASDRYLANHPAVEKIEDLYDHVLIWYIDSALDHRTFSLLYEVLPQARSRIQTNNIAGFIEAAEAGLGVALLPTFIADRNPRLQRITAEHAYIESSYWISFPRDLVRLARVRMMAEYIGRLVADEPGLSIRAE